jgi:tetratricopeptide (TPR) repeat protein
MARDVFISYRKEDQATAVRVCDALEQRGISCWMAPRDIPPGEEWPIAIIAGIKRSHTMVLILSSHSHSSKQISREVETADRVGLNIITFRIEDVTPPPSLEYFLQNIQWIDAWGSQYSEAIEQLARTIRSSRSFPAEKTAVMNREEIAASISAMTAAGAAPAPAPAPAVNPVAASAPAPAKRNTAMLAIAAFGVVAIGGIGTWIAIGRSGTGTANPTSAPAPISKPDATAAGAGAATSVPVRPANARVPATSPAKHPPSPAPDKPAAPAGPAPGSDEARLRSRELAKEAQQFVKSDVRSALGRLDEAIRLDPNNEVAYCWRAKAYANAKLFDRALSDIDKALTLKPKWDFAMLTRGQIHNGNEQYDEAEADFTNVIDNAGNVARGNLSLAYRGRAQARRQKRDFAGAAEDLALWKSTGGAAGE